MNELTIDEESRNLLKRIVERQAYRQLMAANIRAHGLKFVPEIAVKIPLVQDLEHSLRVLREVERMYAKLGGDDLARAVSAQMDRIPYPTSRLELSICLVLCDRAEQIAAEGYVASSCEEFAAVARSLRAMDRTSTREGERLFTEFCTEPGNRPAAQQMLNRWLAIALVSLGRPGTPGDARAVALKLRSKRCADSVREFLAELRPLVERWQLAFPAPSAIGVELVSDSPRGKSA